MDLRDLLVLQSLQRDDMPLSLDAALPGHTAPIGLALASLLPIRRGQVSTFVVHRHHPPQVHPGGFVQVRRRCPRPEADLLHIAPGPYAVSLATLWDELLAAVAAWASSNQVLRLYAAAPLGGEEELVLRRGGYQRYATDTVYRTPEACPLGTTAQQLLRPQKERDTWALQRLYAAVTPLRVQQAEGLTHNGWQMPSDDWNGHGWTHSYVLEDRDGLLAHVGLCRGERGHHFRVIVRPEARQMAPALLDHALGVITGWPRRPAYCTVRHYQDGLEADLLRRGFSSFLSRSLTVRHSVVTVRPALEEMVLKLQGVISTGYNSAVRENGRAAERPAKLAVAIPSTEWDYDKIPDYR